MSFSGFLIVIGIVAVMVLLYKHADRWIRKMDPKTVKTVNWTGFIIGIAGGVLWYLFAYGVFMIITLVGVVLYFLFYGYDTMEEEGSNEKQ